MKNTNKSCLVSKIKAVPSVSSVVKTVSPVKHQTVRLFVGSAWIVETKLGYQVLNLIINKDVRMAKGSKLFLAPNKGKREGHKDPDFSASVVVSQ